MEKFWFIYMGHINEHWIMMMILNQKNATYTIYGNVNVHYNYDDKYGNRKHQQPTKKKK